jgi:CHAT domain-containing protein
VKPRSTQVSRGGIAERKMPSAFHFAFLIGLIASIPVSVYPQFAAPADNGRVIPTATAGVASEGGHAEVSRLIPDRPVACRKAELAAQKGARLREKQTAKDLGAASRAFKQSAGLFVTGHCYDQAADSQIQIGDIDSTVGEYVKAREFYRKALKLGQDPELRCRALSHLARTYATTGPVSLSDSYSAQALKSCERLSERSRAEALEARGEALNSAGDYSKGADCLRRARGLFVEANDDNGEALSLLMLAYALFSNGERDLGVQTAGQALRLWSAIENSFGVAQVRAALGTFAITTGEFETAKCNYGVAQPLFRTIGDRDNEASVLNGLGYINREMGDWQKSLEYYESAKRSFAKVQDLLGEHEAVTGIGRALSAMKNYQRLLPLYRAELGLASKANNPVLVASAFADLAGVYEAQNSFARAETLYRRSLAAYRAADHLYGEGDVLLRLGRLQASQRRYSQALMSLAQANELKERTGQVEEMAKIYYELASVYRRLNRLQDARSAIEKTIEIVENQRVSISSFDSRAAYFASVHRYYALYIQVLMLLHRREPHLGFAEKAFDASERSKVRSLLDLLTISSQDVPCDELLEKQLKAVEGADGTSTRAKLTAAFPVAPTLTLKQVQAEIEGDDTVLLEYALGEEKSYVWAIDQHQITSYELPQLERIRRLVAIFLETLVPAQLRAGDSASTYQVRVREADRANERYAHQLSRLLLAPITVTRAKRVLIVPDGFLQYIPFAALRLPRPGASKGLLINDSEVEILPSASVLSSLRKATAKRRPPTAIAAIFADPVFEENDPRVSNPVPHAKMVLKPLGSTRGIRDGVSPQYFARLPASRNEANAIATILRSRDPKGVHIALDFDANRNYILTDGLARFRLLHFATHGVMDVRRPEMSGLVLSLINRRGKKQDGYLRLGDIYKLKLSADLVVLSSCDSALGKDLESEGTIGLPRGFLYAGAKSVIASLWKVNDEATARLMSSLYAGMLRGESPGSALRSAQLEMTRDEQWSKPYYWAAFVLQGEYR